MSWAETLVLGAVVLAMSAAGTDCMRRLGRRYGFIAQPRADRWHRLPTALHGGLGFFPSFAVGVMWIFHRRYGLGGFSLEALRALPREAHLVGAVLLGALLMVGVGFWDDVSQIRPATKLLFQIIAASVFVLVGGVFPLSGSLAIDTLLTYLWFVGITNAVNMLDNMDGLSSGVVALATLTLVILAARSMGSGEPAVAVALGSVFLAMLIGFWLFNYPPASIFMGDSGSLFIGFVLAALAIPSPLNGFLAIPTATPLGPVLVLLIPAAVLAVPIFDTTLVTITRKWRAQKASQGGRDHSSHRLVGLGLPERLTVWLLYSLAAFGGLVAILLQRFPSQSLPLLALFAILLTSAGVYLGRVKVEVAEPNRVPPAWTPLVSELFFKRRVAEALLDLVLVIVCFHAAYLLRFDGQLAPETRGAIAAALPIVVPICLSCFFLAGIYRGQWHLISVPDLPAYVLGAGAAAGLSLAGVTLATRFAPGHSRGAYVLLALLLLIALLGSRLSLRIINGLVAEHRRDSGTGEATPVLIYGAGRAGKLLHEEISSNADFRGYRPVGFVDDAPGLSGRTLCGLPVRNANRWADQAWSRPPEIWVASRKVPDANARALAGRWQPPSAIRRLRLEVTIVSEP